MTEQPQPQKPKSKPNKKNKNFKKINARELATKVLTHVEESDGRARESLDDGLRRNQMSGGESGLATELVYGVLRRRGSLDFHLAPVSNRPLSELSSWVRNLLRVAMYQLQYLDRIPQSAAVDTAVEATKNHVHDGAAKFVNGVLREFCRRKKDDKLKALPDDPIQALVLEHSQPDWLAKRMVEMYGFEKTKAFMIASNETPPLTLRANPAKTNRDELAAKMVEAGFEVEVCKFGDQALQVHKGGDVRKMPGFHDGHFFVQDESSQLVVKLMGVQLGWQVADVCAAPGGKSTHLAEIVGKDGKVWAFDRKKPGLERLDQNLKRLGLENVQHEVRDALQPKEDLVGKLDAVLVDAPCSGTGVLRRRVESRWQIKLDGIERQVKTQKEILAASAAYLKPGGVLIYSTCSLEKLENEGVVTNFLNNHDDFKFERASDFLPPELVTKEGYYKSWPGQEGMDGFFGARLVKVT